MTEPADRVAPALRLEFCGEWTDMDPNQRFGVGRDTDCVIDENPYLHRRFLDISWHEGLWWLANVGSQLAATLCDEDSRVQAWLAPGSALPVVFSTTIVRFTAGTTAYELSLHLDGAPFTARDSEHAADGTTTLGRVVLTPDQRLLVLALAERALRQDGSGLSSLPSSAEAAARLGWLVTKFNRKLDNVCQKLERAGV